MYLRDQTSQGTIFKIGSVYYANYRKDNKRVKVSLKTKDRTIALMKLKELIAHPVEQSPQFGKLLTQTLDMLQLKGLKSHDTIGYHARAVRKALGHMLVKDVSSLVIQRATLQWLRQKVKPATINRRLYVIRQTLKQAVLHRYINTLPTITNLSERGNERQGFFTREEFQRLYRELPEYARDMCLFAYITGWRKSEITGLQWSAMRWDTMVLLLPKTKNGEQRIFPVVMPEMVALMQRCYEQRNGGLIFHRDGEPLGDFKRAWKSANKRAGMDKLFHDLRRSAVRNFIAAGLPERLVMSLTGHRTNHMLHRYHVLVEADLRDAMSGLGSFFDLSKNGLIAS